MMSTALLCPARRAAASGVTPAASALCASAPCLRALLEMPGAVDDASTLIEDIAAVGPGGQFLARRSSRENSRRGEVWRSSVFQRDGLSVYAGRSLVSDALEHAEALLAAHVPTPVPDDARREARAAFESYVRGAGGR